MNMDANEAEDNLAFMRAIVEENSPGDRKFGIVYMVAGLLYGIQCIANFMMLKVWVVESTLAWMVVGWLPTILFLVVNFTYVWKDRAAPFGSGVTKRAINAAFAGAGIANLILALIFGYVAFQRADWSIWFLFPIVVCSLQGAVWFAMAIIRRRFWMGLVSAGWFVSSAVLGLFLDNAAYFVLALGVGLILFMALPGYKMMRADPAPSS